MKDITRTIPEGFPRKFNNLNDFLPKDNGFLRACLNQSIRISSSTVRVILSSHIIGRHKHNYY